MPEGIEVFWTSQWLNSRLKNCKLTAINVIGGRYKRQQINGFDLFNHLKPFDIKKIDSKGKVMWFRLVSSDKTELYLICHFGLTGEWDLTKNKYSVVELVTSEGAVYFSDMRNFGTIDLVTHTAWESIMSKLGPDLLRTAFTSHDLKNRIETFITNGSASGSILKSRSPTPIVKILLDQTIIGSGIGNYLSAEILYDAKISPHTHILTIYQSNLLLHRLEHSIKKIFKLAFLTNTSGYIETPELLKYITRVRAHNPIPARFNIHPDIEIKPNETFKYQVYKQKIDPNGHPTIRSKIVPGRTTYWSRDQL